LHTDSSENALRHRIDFTTNGGTYTGRNIKQLESGGLVRQYWYMVFTWVPRPLWHSLSSTAISLARCTGRVSPGPISSSDPPMSGISFSDIQERGWCPSSYNCAAKRHLSIQWVGVSKLLNGKPFACNLLNKLCSYDICNNHHYLRLQDMESVFMWNEHIDQGEMDRNIRRWNMLLAQHIQSKLQWSTSVHDECEPQLWNLQPACSLSWLLVLLDELVSWWPIRPLMNWCLTFLNFFWKFFKLQLPKTATTNTLLQFFHGCMHAFIYHVLVSEVAIVWGWIGNCHVSNAHGTKRKQHNKK
jgi:hypothetical protein